MRGRIELHPGHSGKNKIKVKKKQIAGEISTHKTLPGIDHACFQIAEMAMTAMTWERGPGPL